MAKVKSLTEAAKAVLEGKQLDEGSTLPTVGPITGGVSNPNPVDGSTASTGNAKTLRPRSKAAEERHGQNGGGSGPEAFPGPEDLGGATPTSTAKDNLGARASGGKKRDTSVKGSGSNQQPPKHLEEDDDVEGDVVEEDIEISEELQDFIEEAIEAGLSEEEIEAAIAENFELVSEEEELDEELEGIINEAIAQGLSEEEIMDFLEENYQLDELSRGTLNSYLKKSKGRAEKEQMAGMRAKTDKEAGAHFDKRDNVNHARKVARQRLSGVMKPKEMPYHAKEDYQIDMSEDVDALLAGENLSEEFKEKATTIFEAAVKSRLEEEIKVLEEAYAETLEEKVEEIMEQLTTEVDNYLNYVVEQWIEENEIAVESALRSELTEDFISGLRALFAEHYIDIPEDKVNVVEELSVTVEELEEKLNNEIERNVELTAALNESLKNEVISTVCEGLTTTQAEKLRSLAENVQFTEEEEFVEKISTLRENYFPTAVKTDEVLDRVESRDPKMISESNLEGPMANYVRALGAKLPK